MVLTRAGGTRPAGDEGPGGPVHPSLKLVGGLAALVVAGSALPGDEPAAPAGPRSEGGHSGAAGSTPLLQAQAGGDGDSWRDTAGQEYRLGLVNAPETHECYGAQATAARRQLTAAGFRADVYTQDGYGRGVAVVTTSDGTNLNVHLARHGFADDRYLERFRHENAALAAQLDEAFAAAKTAGAGLWGACAAASSPGGAVPPAPPALPPPGAPPAGADCHPDYATCIPVKGDGSGRGTANDLDCGGIRMKVHLRQVGLDPYRLDADGNGVGCESW